jgi:hypothetical protein
MPAEYIQTNDGRTNTVDGYPITAGNQEPCCCGIDTGDDQCRCSTFFTWPCPTGQCCSCGLRWTHTITGQATQSARVTVPGTESTACNSVPSRGYLWRRNMSFSITVRRLRETPTTCRTDVTGIVRISYSEWFAPVLPGGPDFYSDEEFEYRDEEAAAFLIGEGCAPLIYVPFMDYELCDYTRQFSGSCAGAGCFSYDGAFRCGTAGYTFTETEIQTFAESCSGLNLGYVYTGFYNPPDARQSSLAVDASLDITTSRTILEPCPVDPCVDPHPQPVGRCCYANPFNNQPQCGVTTRDGCRALNGVYYGDGTDCSTGCEELGACCDPAGNCRRTQRFICELDPANVFRPGVLCFPSPCPTLNVGSCCFPNGACVDGVTDALCAANGGIWRASTCNTDPCPPGPPDKGACCVLGRCSETSSSECTAVGGRFYVNRTCNPSPCPQQTPIQPDFPVTITQGQTPGDVLSILTGGVL